MRDKRPTEELRELHKEFQVKFKSEMSFHKWLVERGKIYGEVK